MLLLPPIALQQSGAPFLDSDGKQYLGAFKKRYGVLSEKSNKDYKVFSFHEELLQNQCHSLNSVGQSQHEIAKSFQCSIKASVVSSETIFT